MLTTEETGDGLISVHEEEALMSSALSLVEAGNIFYRLIVF